MQKSCVARLKDSNGKFVAIVDKPNGKVLSSMGRPLGSSLEIQPEEILYLLERNKIVLQKDNRGVLLKEAFELLLSEDTLLQAGTCSLYDYKVYSRLKFLGYGLRRHTLGSACKTLEKVYRTGNIISKILSLFRKCTTPESIVFDVYKPENVNKMRKKAPDFRILALRVGERLPGAELLTFIKECLPIGCRLILAIVSTAGLSFLSVDTKL